MPAHRVIVEISPSRIEIAVRKRGGGDVVEWRSERLPRAEWPSAHTQSLAELQPVLARLVGETGSANAGATVIFSTPGAVSALTSCPAKIGAAAAEQAARLALASIADFPVDDAPVDACTLLTDASSAPDTTPQIHVLIGADAEQRASALAALVQSCGLCVERLVPAEAVAIADAVRAATADHAREGVSAIVWIGEHTTVLAAGVPGRLLFVRTIAAGTEALAEALTRPLRPRDPDAAPVTLTHEAARAVLLSVGVPAPEAAITGHPALAGSSLLPHIQPVVQRLSIEIKQSLRFGVPEAERAGVKLSALGPGAAVPGMLDAISRLSGFSHESESSGNPVEPDAIDSATGGLIAALDRSSRLTLSLLPSEVRKTAGLHRLRKALLAGIGAAALFIAYEAFDSRAELATEETQLRALNAAAESRQAATQIRERAFASRQALSGVEGRMRRALGESPDCSALLSILSEHTPAGVRLTALDMQREAAKAGPDTSRVNVRGYVRLGETSDPAGAIKRFVDQLAGYPIVESVRLGATTRAQVRGHESQVFDLSLALVTLPPLQLLPTTSLSAQAAPAGAITNAQQPEAAP